MRSGKGFCEEGATRGRCCWSTEAEVVYARVERTAGRDRRDHIVVYGRCTTLAQETVFSAEDEYEH